DSGIIIKDGDGKIIEREGDFHLPEEKVVGGWAKVYHAKRPNHPVYKRLSVEPRKPKDPTPFWEGATMAEQICKNSGADALRSAFPTTLGELHVDGEIIDVTAKDERFAKPVIEAAAVFEQPRAIAEPEKPKEGPKVDGIPAPQPPEAGAVFGAPTPEELAK